MGKKAKFVNIALSALIFLLVGCAASRDVVWGRNGDMVSSQESLAKAQALEKEGDGFFQERLSEEKLNKALVAYQKAVEIYPTHELYTKLARGYYFLGDGFYGLRGDEKNRDENFTKGLEYAEKALNLVSPEFVASLQSGKTFEVAVKQIDKSGVPAMYWYSVNLGKWAASKGFVTRLKYKDTIKSTMDHVLELEPNYFHAAPWRYFGAYEALTAGLAGGDLEKSEKNFQKAVQLSPEYLGTKVLWAEFLCTKTQDKQMYEKLLKEVLKANADADPNIAPENKIEQMKAQKMLAQIDDNF